MVTQISLGLFVGSINREIRLWYCASLSMFDNRLYLLGYCDIYSDLQGTGGRRLCVTIEPALLLKGDIMVRSHWQTRSHVNSELSRETWRKLILIHPSIFCLFILEKKLFSLLTKYHHLSYFVSHFEVVDVIHFATQVIPLPSAGQVLPQTSPNSRQGHCVQAAVPYLHCSWITALVW